MAQAHEDDSSSDSSSDSEDEQPQQAQHIQVRHQMRGDYPVQSLAHRVEETAPGFEGFPASLDGFVGNNHMDGQWKDSYARVLPGNLDAGLDGDDNHPVDTFTANVIKTYATEGVTKEGLPSK